MDQPRCDFTATRKEWPQATDSEEAVLFSNLTFDMFFPVGFSKVSVIWNELPLYVILYDDKRITVGIEDVPSEETSSDFPLLLKDKKQSTWVPIDIFDIIFTNVPTDKEPENRYERYLWRTAFLFKAITYSSSGKAVVYEKGPWMAYMSNVGDPSNDRFTIVTHRKFPNRFLTIRDNGVELKVIDNLLSTIKLN
jgi:hypothetical protein